MAEEISYHRFNTAPKDMSRAIRMPDGSYKCEPSMMSHCF
jgi:hypothetical protein